LIADWRAGDHWPVRDTLAAGQITTEQKMNMSNRKISFSIYAFFAASLIGMFSGSNEPMINILKGTPIESLLYKMHTGNTIIFNASSGYFGGFITWLLLVKLPGNNKKRMQKRQLLKAYQTFKADLISEILFIIHGFANVETKNTLLDAHEFRTFFETQNWGDVADHLTENEPKVKCIIIVYEKFESEINYILNACDFKDEESYKAMKHMRESIVEIENPIYWGDEYIKVLCRDMWDTLAQYDREKGYYENDWIKEKINNL